MRRSRPFLVLSMALVAGCGGSGGGGFFYNPDGGGPRDFSMPPPGVDLAMPPPGTTYKYVIDHLLVPMQRSDYSIDLNGDGTRDNQFGSIFGALASQGLDPQVNVDQAIQAGDSIQLVGLTTGDPTLATDPNAGATLRVGRPMPFPDFSGNGSFTVDGNLAPGTFTGVLAASVFTSEDPVATIRPVTASVRMPFLFGATPVALPLQGAAIRFHTAAGGGRLTQGQINGSIKQSDIQQTVIPAVAAQLTATVQANPTSPASQQILAIFDTGGCGSALAGDRRIDVCEVSTNAIIQNILAPDVDIWDNVGNYRPNPANTMKDSLSFGVGFTAVRASY